MYDVLRHLDLEPFMLFLVALGTVVAIRLTAGPISRSRPLLVCLALCLCVGGAMAALALLLCFAKIATAGGDDSPPADDERWDPPDDRGGDRAYPWWPDFERELRDYERAHTEAAGAGVRLPA